MNRTTSNLFALSEIDYSNFNSIYRIRKSINAIHFSTLPLKNFLKIVVTTSNPSSAQVHHYELHTRNIRPPIGKPPKFRFAPFPSNVNDKGDFQICSPFINAGTCRRFSTRSEKDGTPT